MNDVQIEQQNQEPRTKEPTYQRKFWLSAIGYRLSPPHLVSLSIEQHSTRILIGMTALFIAILFAGLTIKLNYWAQGYDQIDYQQSIWNTTQGRFLEISHYRHTDQLWGMDFIPAILLIVPFYALFPSALTLNFFQALCMGLGAIPTYGIARDRFGSKLAGLAFAALFLLYPSTWFATMSAPWQPRTLAVPLLLGAFYFLQQGWQNKRIILPTRNLASQYAGISRDHSASLIGFLLCLGFALLTRTDASLCVLAFGMLAAIWRMGWRWALPPVIIALAWFQFSTNIVVPAFYRSDYVAKEIRAGSDACEDYSTNWPGKSPQLAYYCHLGSSAGEIIQTIITQPIRVFGIVTTQPKLIYLAFMLLPLLFLPLLAPDAALPALPILAMNLLTNRPFQYTVREQYQTLVIPGLIIATIIGAARLWRWWQGYRTKEPKNQRTDASQSQRIAVPTQDIASRQDDHTIGYRLSAILLLVTLTTNLAYRNPVISAVLYRDTPARIAAMHELAAMVPPDAPLAVTSFLAPNMMPRRQIYYFPNSPAFPPLELAEYVFIDTRAAALDKDNDLGRSAMREVQNPLRWRVLANKEDLLLLQRIEQ